MYDDNPYGNVGRLQFELLRAVRLVVDTGIHAMRWTRDEATAYMNEAMGDPSGRFNEVDRYVAWPAQATGYKIGALKILELRQMAMDQLGDRFDLTEFHRVVSGQRHGAPGDPGAARAGVHCVENRLTGLHSRHEFAQAVRRLSCSQPSSRARPAHPYVALAAPVPRAPCTPQQGRVSTTEPRPAACL